MQAAPRSAQPNPPQKGAFPLDHDGECRLQEQRYIGCLKQHKGVAAYCRELAKTYLTCRMNNNLMQHEELDRLGLTDETMDLKPERRSGIDSDRRKEEKGFTAGLAYPEARKRMRDAGK